MGFPINKLSHHSELSGGSSDECQFVKNYFDGGTNLNSGSENGLKIDLERIKRINQAKRALEIPKIFNFANCEDVSAFMCCWVAELSGSETVELSTGNTDVCAVDLSSSTKSNHVKNGWTVYNAAPEDKTYCEGFVVYENVSDNFKGNTLFEISMRKALLQNGYTRNVPGAPMCGCMNQVSTPLYIYIFNFLIKT